MRYTSVCADCAEYRRHDHVHGVCAYKDGTIRWNSAPCWVYIERGARNSILREIAIGREKRRHEKMAKEIRTFEVEKP